MVHTPGDCQLDSDHGIIVSGDEDHYADGSQLFEGKEKLINRSNLELTLIFLNLVARFWFRSKRINLNPVRWQFIGSFLRSAESNEHNIKAKIEK